MRLSSGLAAAILVTVVSACTPVTRESASPSIVPDSRTPTTSPVSVTEVTAAPTVTSAATETPTASPAITEAARTDAPQAAPLPTVVRTPRPPTPAPVTGPRTFTTLGVGAALPSDEECAAAVGAATWEPRPANRGANQANVWAQGFRLQGSYLARTAPGYEERVTGNFSGTTDQIIRWAACKWGFDEDDVRAQAVIESYWRQALMSDCGHKTQPETKGCASVGLLQVKGADIPATHPGTWPAALTSTAFNVDYALANRRLCYEGKETWMRQFNAAYGAGDLWGCIGRWYSGRWHDAGAETYIQRVRATLSSRTWATAGF
jgi:hypothetical protein